MEIDDIPMAGNDQFISKQLDEHFTEAEKNKLMNQHIAKQDPNSVLNVGQMLNQVNSQF